MKRLALLLVLGGCADNRPEIAWQSLHAVDTLQTLTIARNPACFEESNPLTARLIGEHPSQAGAVGWAVSSAVAHWQIGKRLNASDAPRWLKWAFNSVSIGTTARAVQNNHDQGIRIGGNCP